MDNYGSLHSNAINSKTKNVIQFNNDHSAQYTVVNKLKISKVDKIKAFILEEFLNSNGTGKLKLPTKRPKAIISVIGGAKYYESNSKIELVVKRGLIKAAQSLNAWIVDGGMHAGVMKYVGESIKTMSLDEIPCIGVAPLLKVNNFEELKNENHCLYSTTQNNAEVYNLDPNHSHFILVNSSSTLWGEETDFLNSLKNTLVHDHDIPVIVIALSGGGVTVETILNGLQHKFPTIITQGTGRVCDALAALVSVARRFKIRQEICTVDEIKKRATANELKLWDQFMKEEDSTNDPQQLAKLRTDIEAVLKLYEGLTLYNPGSDDDESLDVLVLKGFLRACKKGVQEKLDIVIEWGDQAELVEQLIKRKNESSEINPYEDALLNALQKNRPNIFHVLCENHAFYAGTLRVLYEKDEFVMRQLKRGHLSVWRKFTYFPDKLRNKMFTQLVNKRLPSNCPQFEAVLDIFCAIGPAFSEYASLCSQFFDQKPDEKIQRTRLAFIDLLMWAVFTDRFELAKVVWRRTKYHVLSAMMACILYRFLADNAARKQEYLDKAEWFERESLRILNYLEYSDAKKFIKFSSPKALGNATLTDLAAEGKCKAVMAHPHVQQILDEMLYSHNNLEIPSTLSSFQIFINVSTYLPRQTAINLLMCLPLKVLCCEKIKKKKINTENAPLVINQPADTGRPEKVGQSGATEKTEKEVDKALYGHPRIFFNIPIVKFWSNSFFYIFYLVFQAYVLLTIRDHAIHIPEYLLWFWVFSMLVEEFVEISRPGSTGYFSHFTNKMDITLLILNIIYIGFRLSHQRSNNFAEFSASVNALLAACVIGWLRLMAIFPVSSTFGPLFFILIKLFKKDFLLWAVLFSIFAVSFQIGFTSLALQAGMDPYEAYPAENGIFPVSYVAIIGEWAYLMTVMSKTPTGVLFLAVYAFIVQVMLVNLLIAMMGDTYANMRENSDVEWKYYRHTFAMDNIAESCIPPPFNVLYHAYRLTIFLSSPTPIKAPPISEAEKENKQIQSEQKIAKVMRITVDKLAEENDSKENESPVTQIKKMKKAVSGKSGLRKLDDRMNNQNDSLKDEINNIQAQMSTLTNAVLAIQQSIANLNNYSGGNLGGGNTCGGIGGNSGGGNLSGNLSGGMGGHTAASNSSGNLGGDVGGNLGSNLGSNMSSNLGSDMSNNLGSNLGYTLGNNVNSNVVGSMGGGNFSSNIGTNPFSNVDSNIFSNASSNLGSNAIMSNSIGFNVRSSTDVNLGNLGGSIGSNIAGNPDGHVHGSLQPTSSGNSKISSIINSGLGGSAPWHTVSGSTTTCSKPDTKSSSLRNSLRRSSLSLETNFNLRESASGGSSVSGSLSACANSSASSDGAHNKQVELVNSKNFDPTSPRKPATPTSTPSNPFFNTKPG